MGRELPRFSSIYKLIAFGILRLWLASQAAAHPGSGIVVDKNGVVYFTYSGHGVLRAESNGTMSLITVHAR